MPREPLDTLGDLPKEALRGGSNETRIYSHSYGSIGPGLSLGRRAVISLAVAANGALHVKTVILMTPEEMDQAAKKNVGYRPPGKEPRFGTVTGAERPSALRDGVRVYIAGSRWHHRPAMAIRRTQQLTNGHSRRIDRATFRPGDYGRVTQADGIDRWWVRSSNGDWIALSHQRVVENEDGTITLLYLQ